MSIGSPDLLSVYDEVVPVFDSARLQRSHVGAGVGFRISLAPDFFGGEYLRDEALLLLLGAQPDQSRPDQHDAEDVQHHRGVHRRHLLAEDELLSDAGVAAAILLGPAQADPSAFMQLAMPLQAPLPIALALVQHAELVVDRTAAGADLGQICGNKTSELLPEGFVLGAVLEIHRCYYLLESLANRGSVKIVLSFTRK